MFVFTVLSGPQKKCVEDAIDEGTMAIAHNVSDNQAHRHIEDVVSLRQNARIDIQSQCDAPT